MPFLKDEERQIILESYFDIEWCDDVSELRCVRCHRVAIQPYVSSCQHIFCKMCKKFYSDEDQRLNCPRCQELVTRLDGEVLDVEAQLHQLKIFCPYKKYGCNYADQLNKIPSHLMTCKGTRETVLPVESPGTSNMVDVASQITNLTATVGEVKDKVDRLERKTDDVYNKISASTSEDNRVEGKKADMQLASIEEFKSMKSLLESVNQRIQQMELHHQQMALNTEEMRNMMTSIAHEIKTLKNKKSEELNPPKVEWTIKDWKENILMKNCTLTSEIFTLPGHEYDIVARIQHYNVGSWISLQFKCGHQINKFDNNDGFGTVKYIISDQSNAQQKKDILCKDYLGFNEGSGDLRWIFVDLLPDAVFAPPYLMDDCIKITITCKPQSTDRSFMSNNGILVWRVDNYRKRMEEGLYSPTFSPSFYTSPRGYRVRIGLDIPDSLSMTVTPYFLTGQHDRGLPSTFPRKTTVILFNQTDPSKNLVKSEQWVDLELDKIALSTNESMEQNGFIKDNSLLLKIVIEPVDRE